MRLLLDVLDPAAELGLQLHQCIGVGGDADGFHVGEHERERQLELGQKSRRATRLELGVEGCGQVVDRGGPKRLDLGQSVVRLVQAAVQGELPGLLDIAAQFAVQVPQREVGQVERSLVGTQQVGRELGVAGDAGDASSRAGAARAPRP